MKVSQEAKYLAKQFKNADFVPTVYVDTEGRPVFVRAWGRDLVVSKITLSPSSETSETGTS